MLAMLQATRARDRPRLQAAFAEYARDVLRMHALQLLAAYESWSGALNALVDALDFGIDEITEPIQDLRTETACDVLQRAIENALTDTARDAGLLPIVRIERMLVCGQYGVVAEHARDEESHALADAPVIFFTDADGAWTPADRTTADLLADPATVARHILDARRRTVLGNRSVLESVVETERATQRNCGAAAREAALRFLRARSELDVRAHPQFRLLPAVLERELDAAMPDVGMTLALLLDGGGEATIDEFERRYPVLSSELIFALRALLPLSVPRTQEAEVRRLHNFLRALHATADDESA